MVLHDLTPLLSGLPLLQTDLRDLVTPGWLPLVLVLVLGLIIVGLYFSMRKQLRKIQAPVDVDRPVSSRFAGSDDDAGEVTGLLADPGKDTHQP